MLFELVMAPQRRVRFRTDDQELWLLARGYIAGVTGDVHLEQTYAPDYMELEATIGEGAAEGFERCLGVWRAALEQRLITGYSRHGAGCQGGATHG